MIKKFLKFVSTEEHKDKISKFTMTNKFSVPTISNLTDRNSEFGYVVVFMDREKNYYCGWLNYFNETVSKSSVDGDSLFLDDYLSMDIDPEKRGSMDYPEIDLFWISGFGSVHNIVPGRNLPGVRHRHWHRPVE